MSVSETSEAIREAAFTLFADQGYAETTVEQIVGAAGVSRSTFFRTYRSKEAVIFPDHDQLLEQVEARLRGSAAESALVSVTDAVKIVLFGYIAEGERARERYRLTSTVPALRERELTSSARYQQLFRHYLSQWGDHTQTAELRAELMAAAVVAAHNRVLRRWLRGTCPDPHHEITGALAVVQHIFDDNPEHQAATVLILPPGASMQTVETALRETLRDLPTGLIG